MAKKPEPKTLSVVYSVCRMDWKAHGKNPTLEKCVSLLLAELAKRPKMTTMWNSQIGTAVGGGGTYTVHPIAPGPVV